MIQAAVESYRKEIELKIVAEKSRDTLSESFAKAQQEVCIMFLNSFLYKVLNKNGNCHIRIYHFKRYSREIRNTIQACNNTTANSSQKLQLIVKCIPSCKMRIMY